jgi:hypothetical protein
MKIEIDARPATKDNSSPFFALRLYPETNEKMREMEWGINVCSKPSEIRRVCNGTGDKTFHYALIFEKTQDRGKL